MNAFVAFVCLQIDVRLQDSPEIMAVARFVRMPIYVGTANNRMTMDFYLSISFAHIHLASTQERSQAEACVFIKFK